MGSALLCPVCGGSNVWGHEVRGIYDGVLYWQCGECGHKWHRFPPDDYRYARAVPYVEAQP